MDRRRFAHGALALAVIGALAIQLPDQLRDLDGAIPAVRLWTSRDDQYRLILGDVPYDLLLAADSRMPPDASVLLVTAGRDVRHREYTTFHRALYFLAPRPVRWINPAPGDGTWEARWWTTAGLTAPSICGEARQAAATYLLLVDVPAPAPACPGTAWAVESLPGGTLIALMDPGGTEAAASPRVVAGDLAWWWPLSLALALAVPLLLGAAFVSVALRRGPTLGPATRAALSWALGSGAVTLADAGLGGVGLPAGARLAMLTIAAAVAAGWLVRAWAGDAARRPRRPRQRPRDRPRLPSVSPPAWGLGAIVGAQVALVAILALGRPLSIWDGWAHWGMKARVIFLEGRVTEAIYADATRASTHLDYPLHVPLLESWVYAWLGTPDDRLVGVIGLVTYVALLGFCYGTLRRWGASQVGALAAVAVLGSIAHVWRLSAGGFADVPLALLLAMAVVLLAEWLERGAPGALVLGAATAGLLGWTKTEGLVGLALLVLFAAILAIGGGQPLRGRARRAVVALLAGGALLSGGWWAFVIANRLGGAEYRLTIDAVVANLDRLPTIVSMQLSMLAGAGWSFVWPLAAALALAAALRAFASRRSPAAAEPPAISAAWLLPATAGLGLAILSAAYVVTTFEPYTAQIRSSGYRLALQVLPITVLWLGLRLLDLQGTPASPAPPEGARRSGPAPPGAAPAAASQGQTGQR